MDGLYCCSYMRFAVRACIVAAVVGLVLFAAVSLAGAQTVAAGPTFTGWPATAVSVPPPTEPSPSRPDVQDGE